MLSKDQIETAFQQRSRPEVITDVQVESTLRHDAMRFENRDWRSVTVDDWNEGSDAYFGFSPDAFRYFLPSIVALSLNSLHDLIAADQLIGSLDTSGNPEIWDEWFAARFVPLTSPELGVLLKWASFHREAADSHDELTMARVCDTIETLQILQSQSSSSS
jgi:hypothetical protein